MAGIGSKLLAIGILAGVAALPVSAQAAPEPEAEPEVELEAALEPEAAFQAVANMQPELSGDDIYRRVLDNRFRGYEQKLQMESGDRSGYAQSTLVNVKYLSFKEKSKKILSKTIAKYQQPQDVRNLGYLIVNKREGADDQFVYRPSSRRVRRVNLRGEAVFGTDFSFEDIIPQEFEDATYRRLPDENVGDLRCFSVEVTPTEAADSEYSRFVVHVHTEYYIPLITLYWDERDIHNKVLTADIDTLTKYEIEEKGETKQVWIAKKSRIENLKFESFTELDVLELKPNPNLKPRDFSERQLTSSR